MIYDGTDEYNITKKKQDFTYSIFLFNYYFYKYAQWRYYF